MGHEAGAVLHFTDDKTESASIVVSFIAFFHPKDPSFPNLYHVALIFMFKFYHSLG